MNSVEVIASITTVIGLLAAFGLGWVGGHERMLRQRRTIGRLRARLADADALVDRLTGGADDIIRAARGAHHRTEKSPTDD